MCKRRAAQTAKPRRNGCRCRANRCQIAEFRPARNRYREPFFPLKNSLPESLRAAGQGSRRTAAGRKIIIKFGTLFPANWGINGGASGAKTTVWRPDADQAVGAYVRALAVQGLFFKKYATFSEC